MKDLDDRYTVERGRVFLSGTQALVRLPMLQRERDRRAGLNTAGFVSGYRGSPLGGLDQALWKAKAHLAGHDVVFQPGLNEDLAATSVWGTQQVALSPQAKVDGVFAMWYGKGPGVDRSGDVFRHANAAGTSRHGGVLVVAGDDHGAKSSTLPHQSDHIFKACGLPVFYPANVQEYLDLGLHGWAMSRWSGLWVAMKAVTEVVEASASVEVDPDRVRIVIPEDFELPPDGLNIRWPDAPLAQEARLLDYKWYAALAYVRANRLNRTVIASPDAWFGIVTGGKAYLDTRQALEDLGLDEAACARIGIRLFKCGVVWPLEAHSMREFATGLGEILVVEEKRQIIEYALKEELYNWRDDVRPQVYGKFDEKDGRGGEWAMPQGRWLLPAHAELSPALIARAIAGRLLNPGRFGSRFELPSDLRAAIEARLAIIDAKEHALSVTEVSGGRVPTPSAGRVPTSSAERVPTSSAERVPTFCSGCPHNTSTHVPEGSRAIAGIGCHYMATWMPERRTQTFSQMGGEGVPWIGQAPFVNEPHVFANLGDGTYFHSGSLAVRAAIAAGVNVTYKILYNDAVAMTGGQPVDGTLTVPMIIAQMKAEGVRTVVVVTDEPKKYEAVKGDAAFAGVRIEHRDHLDAIQRELREMPGCTILIYDQTCATEKRRRRKRIVDGKPAYPDPARRVVINEAVCEGCGDCSVQSSCVSVEPVETPFGRKRRINQSSCNKDFSCLKGFCPSFVTVEGGALRKGAGVAAQAADLPPLPEPQQLPIEASGNRSCGILVTGVGGTGVVTIGQLLGVAAHLDGLGVSVLDMAGLAQKGGAVFSHVQIAREPERLYATRIATGEADVVIGCDLVVTAGNEALSRMRSGVTRAVVSADVLPTSDFLRNPDWKLPQAALRRNILQAAGEREIEFVEATTLAEALLGDAIFANPMLLGFAWQKGWVPLSRASIERAIELNGAQVPANLRAFEWGRRLAHDPQAVRAAAGRSIDAAQPTQADGTVAGAAAAVPGGGGAATDPAGEPLDAAIARFEAFLVDYQDSAYARRYRDRIDRLREAADRRLAGAESERLVRAAALSLFRLMAIKDEYEVARLHADPAFHAKLAKMFEGDWSPRFHLAPPLLARTDPKTGRPRKIAFGPWVLPVFRLLARLRRLRGTPLDVFGRTAERRMERALLAGFERQLDEIAERLAPDNAALAIDLAELPQRMRGFGMVKEANVKAALERQAALLAQLRGGQGPAVVELARPRREAVPVE